ncbi:hypothetical protein BOSEA31B_10209 [Hyphomicrobiales bacterium]|nr:hypothetical protein BOSEA31B_10209 [Hyphomicrobiales bacterium]CAH1701888.1 hypothetical protein BOSEA1005_21587 [Hyphomicrobiales bacterium]CAI0346045.1 hypothetical protein BO1005MUT1_470203 [Hyphomicrobiales bacterium]
MDAVQRLCVAAGPRSLSGYSAGPRRLLPFFGCRWTAISERLFSISHGRSPDAGCRWTAISERLFYGEDYVLRPVSCRWTAISERLFWPRAGPRGS